MIKWILDFIESQNNDYYYLTGFYRSVNNLSTLNLLPSVSGSSGDIYLMRIKNQGTYAESSRDNSLMETTVGDEVDEKKIIIYPNPTKNDFTIDFSTMKIDTYTVILVSPYGWELTKSNIDTSKNKKLNFSLPQNSNIDIYSVKITDSQGNSTFLKLIKE